MDTQDRNATAVGAYQMEVETAALVRMGFCSCPQGLGRTVQNHLACKHTAFVHPVE